MNNIRRYIIPAGIIVVTTVGFAGLDILTPQETADFRLTPGFGRRVEIVKTSEVIKQFSSDLGCFNPDNPNPYDVYFNQKNRYILYLEKNFDTSSINITVKSQSKNIDTDPAIIIKPLDDDIKKKCQDKVHEESENLNTEEEEINTEESNSVSLKLNRKGTYLMWIGNQHDTKDKGTYSIEIVEERISANQ
jgi:hypothetical protein